MEDIIIRGLHFISIFTLVATLVAEHLLFDRHITQQKMRQLAVLDAVYGISAGLVLVTGLLLWFAVGKPAEFYNTNGFMHLKLSIFVVIAILSVVPTGYLLKNRKSKASTFEVPSKIIMFIRAELALVFILPFIAVIMARGGL